MATSYPTYVDGKGMRLQGRRWQKYCRKCSDYFALLAATNSLPEITSKPVDVFPPRPPTPPVGRMPLAVAPVAAPTSPIEPAPEWNPLADVEAAERRQQRREAMRARQIAALGTIEDVQRPDYESPLGAMFTRAWTRYRDVETIRQEAAQAPLRAAQGVHDLMHQRLINEHLDIDLANQNLNARNMPSELALWMNQPSNTAQGSPSARTRVPLRTRPLNFHAQFYRSTSDTSSRQGLQHGGDDDPMNIVSPIDAQVQRPPQRPKEDLLLNMACKICLEQPINTIIEPCYHAAMCRWCAQIYKAEAVDENGRFDRRLWKCPICRKQIKEVRRFYLE